MKRYLGILVIVGLLVSSLGISVLARTYTAYSMRQAERIIQTCRLGPHDTIRLILAGRSTTVPNLHCEAIVDAGVSLIIGSLCPGGKAVSSAVGTTMGLTSHFSGISRALCSGRQFDSVTVLEMPANGPIPI
ncbi:hypothetical protein JW848_05440 [Candidatus Bipolaricaulota bacterium]|nr:hypothetical protein [Candidatus Bipolaricaulota bacterium]